MNPSASPDRRLELTPAPAELLVRLHRRVVQIIATGDPRFVDHDPQDPNKKSLRIQLSMLTVWLSIDEASTLCVNLHNPMTSTITNWMISAEGVIKEGGSTKLGVAAKASDDAPVLPEFLVRNILSFYNHPSCPPEIEIEIEPSVKDPSQAVNWRRRLMSLLFRD